MSVQQVPWNNTARFFKVVCLLGEAYPDSNDVGPEPDLKTLGGKVTISMNVTKARYLESDGRYRMVSFPKQTYTIQASSGELIDDQGDLGVYLLDSTSPGVDPSGWTFTANVAPTGGTAWDVTFTGAQAVNGVIDLASAASVASSAGVSTLDGRVVSLESQVNPLYYRFAGTTTPTSSADAAGNTGEMRYDANYIYVKTSTGWKRASLTTW